MTSFFFKSLTPATLLSILLLGAFQPMAHSQMLMASKPASKGKTTKVTFVPPGKGQPRKTTGGASRDPGKCLQDQAQSTPYLIPLVPAQTEALTISERPTLLAYIPPTSAKQAFFSLTSVDEGEHIYHRFLPITQSGVVAFSLPDDAPALEMKSYQWSLSLICENALAPDSPMIEGQIRRIQLEDTFTKQLEALPLDQKAAKLAQKGIWYDVLATLAKSRKQNPSDQSLTASWQNVLEFAGLEPVEMKTIMSAQIH